MKRKIGNIAAACTLIVLCIVICFLSGCGEKKTSSSREYYKTVLIDCGRGYYKTEDIVRIIDEMGKTGFEYLILAFGNDGMRFLLDDMSLESEGRTIASEVITEAIIAANDELAPDAKGYWSQADMNYILEQASEKNISIIPLINTPGHSTSITAAMEAAGIQAALTNRNESTDYGSVTFDITSEIAVDFAYRLTTKYIDYFKEKGCRFFHIGMDEYAGNLGGWDSMSDSEKECLGKYLKKLTDRITEAGMTPMVFCDVIGKMDNVAEGVIGINWNGTGLKDHKNLNANYNWYYVLGNVGYEWAGYEKAFDSIAQISLKESLGDPAEDGCMLAAWNDKYLLPNAYIDNIISLIGRMSEYNKEYFR